MTRREENLSQSKKADRWQFPLATIFGLMLLVSIFLQLGRWNGDYAALAATLLASMILVRGYLRSPYRRHLRVVGTLAGGVAYLISLSMPVTFGLDVRGWQAAWIYASQTFQLDYLSQLPTRAWDVANIWLINLGNMMSLFLPTMVIRRPQRMSVAVTILTAAAAVQTWSLFLVFGEVEPSELNVGYWLWCGALTVLAVARLVPLAWRFQAARLTLKPTSQTKTDSHPEPRREPS